MTSDSIAEFQIYCFVSTQRGLKVEEKENTQKVACVILFIYIYMYTYSRVFHTKNHPNYPSNAMQCILWVYIISSSSETPDAGTLLTRMASSPSMSSAEQLKTCQLFCVNRKIPFILPALISDYSSQLANASSLSLHRLTCFVYL